MTRHPVRAAKLMLWRDFLLNGRHRRLQLHFLAYLALTPRSWGAALRGKFRGQ